MPLERDTITLRTIGNIKSQMTGDLEKRKKELEFFKLAIQREIEFTDYVLEERKKFQERKPLTSEDIPE